MKINMGFYRSLKIRDKLFLILFVLLFITSSLSLLMLKISYNIYDNQIITQSSQILNLYSTNIENELKKIEKLSFSVLSSAKVQSYLRAIHMQDETYERFYATDELQKNLLDYSNSENYISSASFIGFSEKEYAVGRQVVLLNDERKKEILKRAREKRGKIVWIEPSEEDNCIIAARQVRSVDNMEDLAVLIIRIDLDKLSTDSSMENDYKSNLTIMSGNKTILSKGSTMDFGDIPFDTEQSHFYRVQNVDNKKFLMNFGTSSYTNWTHVNVLPYETIFKNITFMQTAMFFGYLLISLLVIFIGMKFANGITKPIVQLGKKMAKVENGDFQVTDIETSSHDKCDEIGQLSKDFAIMVNKIDTLIHENYVKQLVIKETELKALQAQINPHFLYNTLESINWLAKANRQLKISTMVKSLGNLLRCSISNKQTVITLEEELKFLKDYVSIQEIRFEQRLDFSMDIAEEIKKYSIPKLILQPIVENSINYGLEKIGGTCKISVTANPCQEYLELIIKDNGPGMDEAFIQKLQNGEVTPRGTGVGLKNIDDRIKIIFGPQYGLQFTSKINEGTKVSIRVPYETR